MRDVACCSGPWTQTGVGVGPFLSPLPPESLLSGSFPQFLLANVNEQFVISTCDPWLERTLVIQAAGWGCLGEDGHADMTRWCTMYQENQGHEQTTQHKTCSTAQLELFNYKTDALGLYSEILNKKTNHPCFLWTSTEWRVEVQCADSPPIHL